MKKGIELGKDDIIHILKHYSINAFKSYKKLWWSLENEVYEIKVSKKTYILKRLRECDEKYLLWNIQLTEKLRKKGIPTPQTYQTREGSYLPLYKGKRMILQEYVPGKEMKKGDKKFVREFARNLGKLDKELYAQGVKGKYLWKKFGHQFDPAWYRSSAIIEEFDFNKAEKGVIKELQEEVNKKKLKKSIIHADYQLNNLKVQKGKVTAILDFGDMHEDYLAFEVAIALNHLFFIERKADKKYISLFFTEYQRYISLNLDEKKAIYYFIKLRMLSGIVWCDLHRKKHPKKAKKLTKWLKGTIWNYQEFEKLSLPEFLKLIR